MCAPFNELFLCGLLLLPQWQGVAKMAVFYAAEDAGLRRTVKGSITPQVSYWLPPHMTPVQFRDRIKAERDPDDTVIRVNGERYRVLAPNGSVLLEPTYLDTCVIRLGPVRPLNELLPAIIPSSELSTIQP